MKPSLFCPSPGVIAFSRAATIAASFDAFAFSWPAAANARASATTETAAMR